MAVSHEVKSLVHLIQRSPDVGEGWRTVSNVLDKSVRDIASREPDLFELERVGDQLRIRLSDEGKVVAKWL